MDLHAGTAHTAYNEVRVSGGSEYHVLWTKFSLEEILEARPAPFIGATVRHVFPEGHVASAAAAPLRLSFRGRLPRPVSFAGAYFISGTDLKASYQLDYYRVSFRYLVWRSSALHIALGLAANFRDARIRLESELDQRAVDDHGFSALISIGLRRCPVRRLELALDCDALPIPPELERIPRYRAEDVALTPAYVPCTRVGVAAGYRVISTHTHEGNYYNFALVHQMTAGVAVGL